MSKNILIIYHSQMGHTEQLAKACQQGVNLENDIYVKFQKAFDTTLEDVIWADGLILATPEYFGNMSGAMKDFFDKTYYPARDLDLVRPVAIIISCENNGTGAERNILSIAGSYVLKPSLDTLIVKDEDFDSSLVLASNLGQAFAAGLSMGIF